MTTPLIAENSRPGNPETEWDVNGVGDPSIQGFATEISINHGSPISFKVKTDATSYRIDVYRIGYYGGLGARLVDTIYPSAPLPQPQPDCLQDPSTRLYDCGNWTSSATWHVPTDARSGVYVARLVRTDVTDSTPTVKPPARPHSYGACGFGKLANPLAEPRASHIVFIVREDESTSDIVFQTADTTWHAFNRYGGSSLDGGFINGKALGLHHRAFKVSYNRPLTSRSAEAACQFFNAEYPMVRWLEANGYDVTYISGVDTARSGERLKRHRVFLSVGLDAYWSGPQRRHVEAARDAGVSLAFFSGGQVFWKTRFEPSIDDSRTPHRTLVCYKETHSRLDDHGEYQAGSKIDPIADEWTGTFRDAGAFNPAGSDPENALAGTMTTVRGWRHDAIQVPAEYGKYHFWRNTEVAALKPGEVAILEGSALGPNWNEDIDNGFRPVGLQHLSETTVNNVPYLQDFGSTSDGGTATHHLTLYRAESGALVFDAGTAEWSWGLDSHHNNIEGNPYHDETVRIGVDPRAPDVRVQQATVNLLADMGVLPANLQSGLIVSTASPRGDPPDGGTTI
jgi:hypothetical protein